MALFYDYNVAVPANLRQICSVWGELDPVLAVALENREIHFFTDEGEKQQGLESYSRSADIVTMPGSLVVEHSQLVGAMEQAAREVNSPHTSRVCLLKWAPAGNRLMSADENGVFAVWKVDSRCQLTLSTQYARQGSFTHCVFATRPALSKDTNIKNDHFSQHVCPQFFFGGEAGSVHYADDLGHISDIQVLNHAIDSMMFYEEQNRLIVITRAVQLIVYQIGATDGTVKPISKVKLSLAGEGSLLETKWASPGLLAIASGEPLVRFWNIRTEENSVLSLSKSSGLNYNVNNLSFSPRRRILVAGVVILHEGNMQRALCGDTAVIQVRPKTLSIEKFQDGAQSGVTITQSMLEASLRAKGVSHDGSTLVVWNGSKAEVYEMKDGDPKMINQFKCFSSSMVLRGESIYRANGNHVEVCNLAGVVKNTISFTEAEGRPAMLSLQNKFLAVGTDRGLLRVFDVSRRDPKALGSMGNLPEAFGDDTNSTLDLALPVSVFFDPQEPRLLVCETVKTGNDNASTATGGASRRDLNADDGLGAGGAGGTRGSQVSDKEITIIFASNEHGLLMQDSFDLDLKYTALLGIQVPRVYFVAKVDNSSSDDSTTVVHVGRTKTNNPVTKIPTVYDTVSYLRTQIMRDFTGLDKVNNEAKQALIDFCYFMTVGNMDEAYRSVKLIENPSVWENMARMCVKTKRLDVAEVCLGNMGHARGAAAVQEAKKEPEIEVAIAMVAIQLGLRDDAARLYRECGRYDLLNKLYQASGYWKKAVDVAAKRDRIHLKTTYHALARHYEEMGDLKEAMEAYEDADTHQKDIPRMLFKLGKVDLLQKSHGLRLMSKPNDMLDCAAYFEEQREMEKAVQLYHRGGNVAKALDLCFQAQLFEELHHLTDELSGSEMAEKMTPPKGDTTATPADKKRRTELLLKLAKCCKQQGSYHLATKKYTQAGNKLKAMKCLLKSGDTEKVIFFANVSRNAQIFVLAANYLQNLDWRKDTEILKNIVGFYTKARAFEQLAAFYAGCAQVEIEEYRDYEKAISALQEAVQVVSKSRADGKEALLKRYEKRILLIEQFMVARQQAKHNPKEMVDIVTKLMEEPGIEEAIRVGDGFAMLVEAYYEEGELNKSFEPWRR
ncbi:WD40-repeat-containing domain [Phytophthora cactorum]|nr:WD40-repeat-containing domain [Phytophthora cactorum]